MSNGPATDQSTVGDMRGETEDSRYRIRPGAPNLPIPEPQRVTPRSGETPPATYAIRPGTPDEADHAVFVAMAEDKERADRRRRRLRWGTGAAVLALCCAAAVCLSLSTVLGSSSKPKPKPVSLAAPMATPTPQPTSAQPNPQQSAPGTPSPSTRTVSLVALLSSATSDSSPLSVEVFFPGSTLSVHNRTYRRAVTSSSSACATTATPLLAAVLTRNGCLQLFRASYSTGTTAVTVGVAVFRNAAQASAVKQQATAGNLESLSGGTLPAFCHGVVCRLSVDAIGRYAYFTVAGYTTGKPVPASDTVALAAGSDMEAMVFTNLEARARTEATAEATAAASLPATDPGAGQSAG